MNPFLVAALAVAWLLILLVVWLSWQLLRQNGRMLLRLEEIEKRLDELEFGGENQSGADQSLVAVNGEEGAREERFSNRSLSRSKIKRDGLKAGTPAPDFRLPRLDGRGDLSLAELRGRRVLLVFSDPHCGPCNHLAPQLQKFQQANPDISLVMISRGDPKENRAKVKEHALTFTIVLQQQWEISRKYAMFATPIAYLIDEAGVLATDVAAGVESILRLFDKAAAHIRNHDHDLAIG